MLHMFVSVGMGVQMAIWVVSSSLCKYLQAIQLSCRSYALVYVYVNCCMRCQEVETCVRKGDRNSEVRS